MSSPTSPTTHRYAPLDEIAVGEAARIAGVSQNTIRRLTDDGAIPCRRLPRSGYRRFRRADVERVFGLVEVSA